MDNTNAVHRNPIGVLGKILRNAREKKNMSLRELSRRIDVTPSALSHFEQGERLSIGEKRVKKAFHILGANEDLVHDLFVINDMHKREVEFKKAIEEKCRVVDRTNLDALDLSREELCDILKIDFDNL